MQAEDSISGTLIATRAMNGRKPFSLMSRKYFIILLMILASILVLINVDEK